jgi:hypothetical protein
LAPPSWLSGFFATMTSPALQLVFESIIKNQIQCNNREYQRQPQILDDNPRIVKGKKISFSSPCSLPSNSHWLIKTWMIKNRKIIKILMQLPIELLIKDNNEKSWTKRNPISRTQNPIQVPYNIDLITKRTIFVIDCPPIRKKNNKNALFCGLWIDPYIGSKTQFPITNYIFISRLLTKQNYKQIQTKENPKKTTRFQPLSKQRAIK